MSDPAFPPLLVDALKDAIPPFTEVLKKAGLSTGGIAMALGPRITDALYRGEPGAVRWAIGRLRAEERPLGVLLSSLILRAPLTRAELAGVLGEELLKQLIASGFYVPAPSGDGEAVRFLPAIELRPHLIAGKEQLVFSHFDASMVQHVPGPDHVLGVGAASISLLQATPLSPTGKVLDLGTGSGVQALAQSGVAQEVVATDVHQQALDMAALNLTAAGIDNVELRHGSWFEPVAGELFDRIVANPPFVVGPAQVGHVYRDSGLGLDAATRLVVSTAPKHLVEGGQAFLLGSWVHTAESSWQTRIASWLPDNGVAAWVVERDVVDPELYVSTWLQDESIDPRSAAGQERTAAWLSYFAEHGVTGIGLGFVAMEKLDSNTPTEVVGETLSHPFTDPLGPEFEAYFRRAAWLRNRRAADIAAATFGFSPQVAKETVEVFNTEARMGFSPVVQRITRMDGPRFSHEVDHHVSAILAGLHPQGLNLGEVVELYSASQDLNAQTVLPDVIAIVVDLVRHGIVLPAELLPAS